MTKFLLILLTTTITYLSASGQDLASLLKNNAIKIDKLDSLNNKIYDLLHHNKLIMIGEMHGTNEPAKFVKGLTELFTANGDSVQVGFEIPSELMTTFLKLKTDSSIYRSDFFSNNSSDGRASLAWALTILNLNKNPKVKIFFYDINSGEAKNIEDRDSLMYVKIKKQIIKYPTWTTITLSGNIHNMRLPYKQKNKTGSYLVNDADLNISGKFCSINHNYQSGTMLNNIGKGLELRQVGNINSDYAKLVDYDNYLFLFPINETNAYDGIFFTRTVSAAELANKK
jgi:hypothetical protein